MVGGWAGEVGVKLVTKWHLPKRRSSSPRVERKIPFLISSDSRLFYFKPICGLIKEFGKKKNNIQAPALFRIFYTAVQNV